MAAPDPVVSATAPPTIITTKTSILCKAVRDVIAPVLVGLRTQDEGIQHGRILLTDLSMVTVSHNMQGWVYLDDMRILDDVDSLAGNNIKINQLLDQLDELALNDPAEAADAKRLAAALRVVAEHQTDALNEFSGSTDSQEFFMLALKTNPMSRDEKPETMQPPPPIHARQETLYDASLPGAAAHDVLRIQYATSQAELAVTPALQPVIDRCK